MRITVFKSGGNAGEGGFVSNGLTLQGPLILSGPHSEPLHAVPKQYVDNIAYNLDANNITSGILPTGRLPAFTGDATTILGSSNIILTTTGVTPGSIVKPTVDVKGRITGSGTLVESDIGTVGFNKITANKPNTLNGYGITDGISLFSDVTIESDLILHSDPTDPTHAVTKQYVDTASGQAGGISVGDIIRKPYTTTPTGFLKCNGAEVDKTTYANLYSVIDDRFKLNTTIGTGKPWQQQYEINELQNSDLIGWSTVTPLPGILAFGQAIVTKNRVYLLSGYNGTSYVTTVYTAPINSDGTLGTWTTGTALPGVMAQSQAVITKNRVYLLAGTTSGSVALTTVYTAPINSDGTLGSWTTGPVLPSGIFGSSAVVIGNKFYLICGYNGSGAISTIYSTTINDDGTINSWSVYGTFPISTSFAQYAVIRNRLYIFGGVSGSVAISQVYYCEINSDGTLGSWNSGIGLPTGLHSSSIYVSKNKVYIIGGMTSMTVVTSNIYSANINSDGSLTTWEINSTLPSIYGTMPIIATKDHLFAIGGRTTTNSYSSTIYSIVINGGMNDYSTYYEDLSSTVNYMMPGSGKPWTQQYQINTTQSTDITDWVVGTALYDTLIVSQAIVTKNRVYLLGGSITQGSTHTNKVYTALINSDGTLGTWTTGTALPASLGSSQAIVTKNRVYLLGGFTNGVYVSTVYTAPINSDGTIGTWTTGTSLPANIAQSQVVVTKNRVYLMGGHNGTSYLSTVYTAPINSDGTLGDWVTSASLPGSLGNSQAIITKNRVYLCGGYNGTSFLSTVYTSTINSDGTLGVWTTGTALPASLGSSQAIVTKNRVYLLGGNNGTYVSTIYTAPINTDGTLGTWTTGTSLPGALGLSHAIMTKNRVYLLGGANTINNDSLFTVYTATINSDINDYSSYYDGTIQPVSTISTKFKLPDYTMIDKEFGEFVTSYIKY